MSIYLMSACGATGSLVDFEDVDLNPDGVICCSNCRSIIACREAWYAMYGNPYKTDNQDIRRVV